MKLFSKKTPAERRAALADQLAAAESEAVSAKHERTRLALAGMDTAAAEDTSLRAEARITTYRDALAALDREIAQAEIERAEKERRRQHAEAANIFVARLADARRHLAQVHDLTNAVRPIIAAHDHTMPGYASVILGAAADHIGQPIVHALDIVVGDFERAILSLKNGDEHADDLARRALANQ